MDALLWFIVFVLMGEMRAYESGNDDSYHNPINRRTKNNPMRKRLLDKLSPSDFFNVFLDHGASTSHAEIFPGVVRLVEKLILKRGIMEPINFIISKRFANGTGLKSFWEKYKPNGRIFHSRYEFRDLPSYRAIVKLGRSTCKPPSELPEDFDLHVVVTMTKAVSNIEKCLAPYQNNSQYIFIVHHAEPNSPHLPIIKWDNVYLASESETACKLTPRTFSVAYSVAPWVPPDCERSPVFLVQGDLYWRRDQKELKSILNIAPEWNFTIRILTKSQMDPFYDQPRVEFLQDLDMVSYHEAIRGAAFVLPLISPTYWATQNYFNGHVTSSLAYGVHFRLGFVANEAVLNEYSKLINKQRPFVSSRMGGFWHKGSISSILETFVDALHAFDIYCFKKLGSKGKWNQNSALWDSLQGNSTPAIPSV